MSTRGTRWKRWITSARPSTKASLGRRLPHLFSLRAEHQVYRYGVAALTLAAAALLVVVGRDTQRMIPLFAIGAVSVQYDAESTRALRSQWQAWECGVHLDILTSTRRDLLEPITEYVIEAVQENERRAAVLIPEVEPRRRRHQLLQNQRGILLAAVRSRTDAIICILLPAPRLNGGSGQQSRLRPRP